MLLENKDRENGENSLVLEVRDWGRGFQPENVKLSDEHVGLQSMQERVNLLGGKLTITSVEGEGTAVRAALPLNAHFNSESEDEII